MISSTDDYFVLSQCTRLTDRRTDGKASAIARSNRVRRALKTNKNHHAVALSVDGVSAAVEFLVVAVSAFVEPTDVDTRAIAVRRWPMWITSALLVVADAAVAWCVVVTTTVQEVTAENCDARGRVVQWCVVLVALTTEEVLAVCWCVVTAAYFKVIKL